MYQLIIELNYYKQINKVIHYSNLYKTIKSLFLIINFKINQDLIFKLKLLNLPIFQQLDLF